VKRAIACYIIMSYFLLCSWDQQPLVFRPQRA